MSVTGTKKLEEKILQDLARIINYELADPRLAFVSITRVELGPGGQTATVHWSALGDEAKRRTAERTLDHARGHIQNQLGKGLKTRHTPRLDFVFDPAIERGIRFSQLLGQIERERKEAEAQAAAEAGTEAPPACVGGDTAPSPDVPPAPDGGGGESGEADGA